MSVIHMKKLFKDIFNKKEYVDFLNYDLLCDFCGDELVRLINSIDNFSCKESTFTQIEYSPHDKSPIYILNESNPIVEIFYDFMSAITKIESLLNVLDKIFGQH